MLDGSDWEKLLYQYMHSILCQSFAYKPVKILQQKGFIKVHVHTFSAFKKNVTNDDIHSILPLCHKTFLNHLTMSQCEYR